MKKKSIANIVEHKSRNVLICMYYNCLIFFFIIFFINNSFGQKDFLIPVFKVDFSNQRTSLPFSSPTSDKPQSKLWYYDSSWWALINTPSGPALWERNNNGWIEHLNVSKALKGIPGQCDVWYENQTATAVGVSDTSLYVFRLTHDFTNKTNKFLKAEIMAQLPLPYENPNIETATIVKDASGIWWVAADIRENSIYVWSSKDAKNWSDGILIGENIFSDDICSIAALKESVIVIWSNQNTETVYAREHKNGYPVEHWSDLQIIDSGNKTADDHINTALSVDGTLWVATKNEANNYPIFVLRVRNSTGNWQNYPYLPPGKYTEPTRPAVFTTPNPDLVLIGHTLHKKNYFSKIVFGRVDTSSTEVILNQKDVIAPETSVNNITGPKAQFPSDAPWIILASDNNGNVYEADLRDFFEK